MNAWQARTQRGNFEAGATVSWAKASTDSARQGTEAGVGDEKNDRRIYRNPPIVEAVCTFFVAEGTPWNPTIPGRFYDAIEASYPEEPEEQITFRANWEEGQLANGAQLRVESDAPRASFRNGSRIVSLSSGRLAVHSLAPYEGWDSLRARTLEALEAYRNVVGTLEVEGISLRYVNRIFIPQAKMEFNEYFTVAQALPTQGFPGSVTSFFDRMEVEYADAPVKISFTWSSDDQIADKIAFIMDFDLRRSGPIEAGDVPRLLDDLRERERVAFESLIQDSLREIFDAGD